MQLSSLHFLCRWSQAVDAAIGNNLANFVVHDAHDMRLLRDLGRECQMGARLSISVFSYDVPRHVMHPSRLPPAQLLTLLQALTCNSERADTVMNVFIDQVWRATALG